MGWKKRHKVNVNNLLKVIEEFVKEHQDISDVDDAKQAITDLKTKFDIATELGVIKNFVKDCSNPPSKEDASAASDYIDCLFDENIQGEVLQTRGCPRSHTNIPQY